MQVALPTASKCSQTHEVPDKQAFYFDAISATAQLLEDPDWEAIACQAGSYVTGVAIGFDEPAG